MREWGNSARVTGNTPEESVRRALLKDMWSCVKKYRITHPDVYLWHKTVPSIIIGKKDVIYGWYIGDQDVLSRRAKKEKFHIDVKLDITDVVSVIKNMKEIKVKK